MWDCQRFARQAPGLRKTRPGQRLLARNSLPSHPQNNTRSRVHVRWAGTHLPSFSPHPIPSQMPLTHSLPVEHEAPSASFWGARVVSFSFLLGIGTLLGLGIRVAVAVAEGVGVLLWGSEVATGTVGLAGVAVTRGAGVAVMCGVGVAVTRGAGVDGVEVSTVDACGAGVGVAVVFDP